MSLQQKQETRGRLWILKTILRRFGWRRFRLQIAMRAPAPSVIEVRGFTWADILWALGIWSVIVCLSPVIVFYMLMVA